MIPISKKQYEVLALFWREHNRGMTKAEILEAAEKSEHTWKQSSFYTILNQLLDKGLVEVCGVDMTEKALSRKYRAAVTAEEYAVMELVRNEYIEDDSKKTLMSALLSTDSFSPEGIERLEKVIEQASKYD